MKEELLVCKNILNQIVNPGKNYLGILGMKKSSFGSKNANEELSKVFKEKHHSLGLEF